jgi:hypothetical protein
MEAPKATALVTCAPKSSTAEIKAAAPPPQPFSKATICGIPVIGTIRAPAVPKTPPMTMATTISIPRSGLPPLQR